MSRRVPTGRPPGNPNWTKGVSGNPSGIAGRRMGTSFTMMVRQRVDPARIIALAEAMAFGEPVIRDAEYTRALYAARAAGEPDPPRPSAAEVVYPTVAEQQAAFRFLIEWGYQKPAERLEIAPTPEADLSQLTDEELELYERLLAKASGAALPGGSSTGRVIDATGVEVARALPAPR